MSGGGGGDDDMSLEDMVEEYSKKWKVSREEAERKIRKILERAEGAVPDRGGDKTPAPDNLFPEPIGEISRKIQDINQAALSTAYTARLLKNPPEEVAAMREKIEQIEAVVAQLKDSIENKINTLTAILDEKTKKEQREELLKELESRVNPLKETLEALSKKLQGAENTNGSTAVAPKDTSSVLEEAERVAEQAKKWLSKIGYKVEPERLSREEVQRMIEEAQKRALENLPADEVKKRLEQAGYKVVGGPLTWDQVEKMLQEERKKAQEEVLDDKRIETVSNIVKEAISRIIELFKPAVETMLTPKEAGEALRKPLEEASASQASSA